MNLVSALIGALAGLLFAPLSSMLVERPPLVTEEVEPLGLPFRCTACRNSLQVMSLVPIVSFLIQGGKCRSCSAAIPRRELVNDLLCLVVGAITGATVGMVAALPAMLVLGLVLVPVSLVDLERRKIATRLVYPAAAIVLVLLAIAALVDDAWPRLGRAALAGLAASAFIWLLVIIVPAGMGQGDARLMLMLGLGLGWLGWLELLWGIMFGFLLGSFVGIFYGIYTKRYLKEQVPFGPWLGLGAMVLIWWKF